MSKGAKRLVGAFLIGFLIIFIVSGGCGGCGDDSDELSGIEAEQQVLEERVDELEAEVDETGSTAAEPQAQEAEERAAERQTAENRDERLRKQLRLERRQLIDELNAEFAAWQTVPFTGPCRTDRAEVLEELGREIGNMQEALHGGSRETINNARSDLGIIRSERTARPTGTYRREGHCSPTAAMEYAW